MDNPQGAACLKSVALPLDSGRDMAQTMWMGATLEAVDHRRFGALPSIVGETDDDLIARVRAGDDTAFEKIYDRYARGVLAFCVHMLKSREAAEDAVQLTFVSAYRAVQAGTNEIALRPWLYTIARNRCLSEIRARHEVEYSASDPAFFNDLTDQVQRREDLREMLDDIRRLPDDQRAALVLFELGDNSHKEIAAILGVRAEKVKALIFQARQGLARGRLARDHTCVDIRERIAGLRDVVPTRSLTRAHIDRCPSCAAFEAETRRQRAALALILPVPLAAGLKPLVLGSALHGGAAAAGAGASAGGAAAAGAGVTGGGAGVTGGGAAAAGAGADGAGAAGAGGGATGAGGAGAGGGGAGGGGAGAGGGGGAAAAGGGGGGGAAAGGSGGAAGSAGAAGAAGLITVAIRVGSQRT
jgi:RNA polymerase sigma factor (sigma-70 family)